MSTVELPASAVDTSAPVEWGVRRTMTDFEATMWRMEADPRLRSPVAAVEVLDRPPDWHRFLAAHEWATRILPTFPAPTRSTSLGRVCPRCASSASATRWFFSPAIVPTSIRWCCAPR